MAADSETTTWNGATSYATVNSALIELYFKSVRNISCEDYRSIPVKKCTPKTNFKFPTKTLEEYFDAAWKEDPLRTLKFVFHLRDCREGKGERMLFRSLILHMRKMELVDHLRKNLHLIPEFGYWKDLLVCFLGTELEDSVLDMFADQLKIDRYSENPSLCARYAPSEKGIFDRKHDTTKKLCQRLNISPRLYRKLYLKPIRTKLGVVEQKMCSKEWDKICYSKVPSIAGNKYKDAFHRNDKDRYAQYLEDVKTGKTKMNTGVLMPYEIVGAYLQKSALDDALEAQWISFLKDRDAKYPPDMNILPLIDVSGSMFGVNKTAPINNAIALGMLFSILNRSSSYTRKFITFESDPKLMTIPEGTLFEQINYIKKAPWGGSTNFQGSLNLILDSAVLFQVPAEKMPKTLLVLSDMQFDQADDKKTNWEVMQEKYEKAGYERPEIIFWNLNGSSVDFPIPHSKVPKCRMLSGFNDTIMYTILDGEMKDPLESIREILDRDRYSCIELA